MKKGYIESGVKINGTSLWKIKHYLRIVGTSNMKNVIKFLEYTKNKRTVLTIDLEKNLNTYVKTYEKVRLPYFYKGL